MTVEWDVVRRVCASLLADLEPVLEEGLDQLRRVPSYSSVPVSELLPAVRANVRLGLSVIAERRGYTDEELSALSSTAGRRARAGVPADELLDAFSLVDHAVWEAVRDRLLRVAGPQVLLALSELRLSSHDALTRVVVREHRRVELAVAREAQDRQAATVVGLLHGGLPEAEVVDGVRRLGFDPSSPLHVWRVRGDATRLHLSRSAFACWSDEVISLSTGSGTASGLVAGTAGPVAAADLSRGYQAASDAFATAAAFHLDGVHTVESLGLHAAVVGLPSIGAALRKKYVAPLEEVGTLGEALLETTKVYLASGSRREATARALHLHTNTVGYRLNRFAALTGADFEDHAVLAELWWLFRDLEVHQR